MQMIILEGFMRVIYNKELSDTIVASHLGVELDDAHNASADVTATLDVLGAYTAWLRNNEGAAIATQQRDKTRKHFKI